jgi:hypothetical protein
MWMSYGSAQVAHAPAMGEEMLAAWTTMPTDAYEVVVAGRFRIKPLPLDVFGLRNGLASHLLPMSIHVSSYWNTVAELIAVDERSMLPFLTVSRFPQQGSHLLTESFF